MNQVERVLRAERGVRVAVLYGSVATGYMRPDSDVDVAVLLDSPMDAGRKMAIISRLEAALSREVDLVDLSALTGTILKQILCKGRVLIKTPAAFAALMSRMLYNQQDMMPYVTRTLLERQRRFIGG